jgi:membrane protein
MNSDARKTAVVVTAIAVVGITKGVLPWVLTWLANWGIERVPRVSGRVRRVRINFMAPGLTIQDVSLTKQFFGEMGHRIEVRSITFATRWKALLTGTFVGSIEIGSPRLSLDFDGLQRGDNSRRKTGRVRDPVASQQQWQDKVQRLPGFKLSPIVLTNGEVRIRGIPGEQGAEIAIDNLNLRVENLTNRADLAPTLMTKISVDARVLTSGELELRAEGYPLAKVPTFNADFSTSKVDLTELRSIIEKAFEIDVRRGVAGVYLEAAASGGRIIGYVKPVFDHLELEPSRKHSFVAHVKAWAAEFLAWFGKNKRKDRIATRLDFDGAVDDPDFDFIDAALRFLRNAFTTAERASLEHRIWFSRAGRTADEVMIQDHREPRSRTAAAFWLAKETLNRWSADAAPRMAAALSYYMAFSMAPLLILAISIAGLLFGREAAQGKIVEEIGGLIGTKSADAIQAMLQAANRPAKGVVVGIIGIFSLVAGASGVLSELKSALNRIWQTEERSDIKEVIKKNVLFVGMLLGIGFLLTVSLVVSAGLASIGKFLSGLLPASELILHGVDFFLSATFVTILFAAMYRLLPNTRVDWLDVWIGAAVTSVLFNLGKLGLGLYIGKSAVASLYGAAGSVLVLLLWVYYSGLIFYFGAEFTKVYADRYGSRHQAKTAGKYRRRNTISEGFDRRDRSR